MTTARWSLAWPRLRASLLFLVVLACACGVPPSPRALVMRDVSFPLRDLRFPSGLRVIVEEDHRAPVVGVVTLVGSGSTSDPPGKEGLAHYVEHLTFRSRPDGKTSISSLLGRAGTGSWNAYTGLDETVFHDLGPKEALPGLVLLEGVRMLAPVSQIAPDVAAVELEVVKNELRQRNETGIFGSILGWMQAAVFPGEHPYARPVVGSREALATLTLEDAERFAKASYRPDNITMVVIGDVDMQTVGRVVEESLPRALLVGTGAAPSPAPRLDAVAAPPPAPPAAGPMARREAGVATPELWIGWSLPRSFDTEGYLDRFVTIAAASSLPRAFRRDEAIAGVGVHLVEGKQAAMLLCRVALNDASDPDAAMEHVLDQLVHLWIWDPKQPQQGLRPGQIGKWRMAVRSRSDEYEARELGFVRLQRAAVTSMVLGAESLVERGATRAELTHFSGDPTAYSRELRAIMGTDAGKVADFASKYLTRERARAVLVTPPPDGARPPSEDEGAAPAPLEDAGLTFDASSIRQFVHAPGVGAYRRLVLENGLEVILGRRAGLPVASVGLSLHGGSATASPPGADQLARRLGVPKVASKVTPWDFGGHLDDHYDRDGLGYRFQGAAGNVGNMLELLADRAPGMWVDPGVVGLFDREIVPFLKRSEMLPETQASRAFWRMLYGDHPYGRSTAAGDLEKLGAGDANAWTERVAVGRNAVLAIVGEIDPIEVEGLVQATFGRWPRGDAAQAPPPPPVLPSTRAPRPTIVVAHRPGATQGELRLGCLLPPVAGAQARYAMVASLLDHRVLDAVRLRLGASYAMGASTTTLRGGATHLTLQGDVDNAHLGQALDVVKRSLDALEHGDLAPGELERARWRVARAYGVRYLTNASIVSAILAARNEARELASIDAFPTELAAVTAEQLSADFARCATAPVLSVVGDEPTVRAALAEVWP